MSLSAETRSRIERTLAEHRVVLFMKGDRQSPRCGFSAKAVGILDGLVPDYQSVDVLADPEIREGIKEYGQWPTIPQLYVGGELVGGSDIIEGMLNSGELHELLALDLDEDAEERRGEIMRLRHGSHARHSLFTSHQRV